MGWRLHSIAPELNAASDAATDVVRRLEKILTDLNLGVSAETAEFERRIEDADGNSSMLTYRLAFGRVGKSTDLHPGGSGVPGRARRRFRCLAQERAATLVVLSPGSALLAFQALPALLERIASKSASLFAGSR